MSSFAEARNDRHAAAEYRTTGPSGSFESRMVTVPRLLATSAHAPWFRLRLAFRQLRFWHPSADIGITTPLSHQPDVIPPAVGQNDRYIHVAL
jgi:hypothetical protein